MRAISTAHRSCAWLLGRAGWAGTGKAVREDAAFEVFGKRFAYIGLGAVVVALVGKLARAGQVKPGLVVLGHRLVEQRALWVTRKVNRRALMYM